ncbi:MAG: 2-C-methyl-D-erythritol 4-phosphate cytidylyltransferase [Bacteroidales bacterium]|nr:2-C-methyl-D-erythritol 4-phosphate cytidylyltransferase [Bacteroidales bacterium]
MIFAAILAGGKGTRVGTNIPKQFLNLGEKPIIIRTIDVFLTSGLVDFIYISVNEMWIEHMQTLLKQYYSVEDQKRFKIVNGGVERIMSFLNIIYDIRDTFGINEKDMVLSHDAVRPFVTCEIIKDCIEKTMEFRVAMAAIPSADTTYCSLKEGLLTGTYDRKLLWYGQTPQGCNMKFMYDVICSYTQEELLKMTGTSQLFINKGIDVKISLGSGNNLKITTLQDVDFSEYIMKKTAKQ